jgi:hypothetical protein
MSFERRIVPAKIAASGVLLVLLLISHGTRCESLLGSEIRFSADETRVEFERHPVLRKA